MGSATTGNSDAVGKGKVGTLWGDAAGMEIVKEAMPRPRFVYCKIFEKQCSFSFCFI